MSAPQVVEIALDQIDASKRLRALDNDAVAILVASMQEGKVKRLLQPITVRPIGAGYKLVMGAHRLEAAKRLGWETISCIVEEGLKEDDALIQEIDENLHRRELSPYDEAEFATMRWRLRLKKHDKRTKLPQLAELSEASEGKDFFDETARTAGVHPETIRRAVLRRLQLDSIWHNLKGTDAARKGASLDRLRKKFKHDMDQVVIRAAQFDGSIDAAMDAMAAGAAANGRSISASHALRNLKKAWKNCPRTQRNQFLEFLKDEGEI